MVLMKKLSIFLFFSSSAKCQKSICATSKRRTTTLASLLFVFGFISKGTGAELSEPGLHILPYLQEIKVTVDHFIVNSPLTIVLNKNHFTANVFADEELMQDLQEQWCITAITGTSRNTPSIAFIRDKANAKLNKQSYQIITGKDKVIVKCNGGERLFYDTHPLLQLAQKRESLSNTRIGDCWLTSMKSLAPQHTWEIIIYKLYPWCSDWGMQVLF